MYECLFHCVAFVVYVFAARRTSSREVMMQSSALEKCSALVEEFVASCDLGDEDETVNDSVNRPIGLERRDSYRSDDGNSSSSVSSPTPTHHFADALVSRRANVPHSQR